MKHFFITLLMCSIGLSGYFQDNFLKYSTFYASTSLQSPFNPKQTFAVNQDEGTFVETTEKVKGSYNLSLGIRKLARFKYQSKKSSFYDGSENELSEVATLGAVSGWEYLVRGSSIRQFGEEYINSESWVRYLGDNYVVKGVYANFGLEDLEFAQLDARGRKPIGSFGNLTVGTNFRGHPAYGLFPFNDWLANNSNRWGELAYDYGYYDEPYTIDDIADYYGYDSEGELIADSDDEFYEYYYGDLIHLYNEDSINKLGYQGEASAVLGVDYYRYEKKWGVHSWFNIMPISKGLTEYSFKYQQGDIDYECGVVAGIKINPNFGIFGEGRYLSYWGINAYQFKLGFNYTVF